jgi:hypothetical protein
MLSSRAQVASELDQRHWIDIGTVPKGALTIQPTMVLSLQVAAQRMNWKDLHRCPIMM